MSVSRRRRIPAHADAGHGPDERWMASYLDMITVLMCMFIVMFAMSNVDQEKFEALRASLATGFGAEQTDAIDVSTGVVVPPDLVDDEGESFFELPQLPPNAAEEEYDSFALLRERLEQALEEEGLEEAATFTIDERGLTMGLKSAETFFATNSTALSAKARAVLDAAATVLADDTHDISVEGHADFRRPSPPFRDNWELSSARATGVLRYLANEGDVAHDRISSVGYGSSRPLAEGTSAAALAQNRRVDIVVLSAAEDDVRAELPRLDALAAGGP
ncbi:MAG: flagellar motor protein MotB [Candidatus Microbacterium phytovorans]|uniref:Flagellar motor protein MotB n=1 Tax=Candidatus Microbacterium phytovorans TaxID=3121374 RepID=A0AAJ5W216_9MICO|nr:flagellar motor protein MotB [Microbacterium sp.]WEK13082.1 MAG: flagellar motor protein MotB [Microbacterium sp.]